MSNDNSISASRDVTKKWSSTCWPLWVCGLVAPEHHNEVVEHLLASFVFLGLRRKRRGFSLARAHYQCGVLERL